MSGIDWHEQWALFAQNFKEGKAHIPIRDKMLFLQPGPGFGDLSHPTTALMIEKMQENLPLIQGKSVVDIGTGSGILALAALLLGAESAHGIDIDPEAIQHAKENAKLNHLAAQARFSLKLSQRAKPSLFLMNMISSEQMQIGPQQFNSSATHWITSGILRSQRAEYLDKTQNWDWKLVSESEKDGWSCYLFKINSNN